MEGGGEGSIFNIGLVDFKGSFGDICIVINGGLVWVMGSLSRVKRKFMASKVVWNYFRVLEFKKGKIRLF